MTLANPVPLLPAESLEAEPSSGSAGPAVIVFGTKAANERVASLEPTFSSWKDGPAKMRTFARRGRPPKNPRDVSQPAKNEFSVTAKGSSVSVNRHYKFIESPQSMKTTDGLGQGSTRLNAANPSNCSEKGEVPLVSRTRRNGISSLRSIPTPRSARQDKSLIVPQSIGSIDPFDSLPIRMSPDLYRLLIQYISWIAPAIYSIERYRNINPAREFWLPMAVHDAALLHSMLGCADMMNAGQHKLKGRPSAVLHLGKAIQIVNQRLAGGLEEQSDATIAVICTMAIMEKISGYHDHWAIHMNGLKQLVNFRGSLETFKPKSLVYLKICRVDLCGSIDAVQRPFFADSLNISAITQRHAEPLNQGFLEIDRALGLDRELKTIIGVVEEISATVNLLLEGTSDIDPNSFRETVTLIQYALLCMTPFDHSTLKGKVQELCRLGLLLYFLTIIAELPRVAKVCDMLISKLRDILDNEAVQTDVLQDFRIWLTFLVGFMANTASSRSWFQRTWRETIATRDVTSHGGMRAALMSFLWVSEVHASVYENIMLEL